MFYPSSMPPTSHLLTSAERPPSPASSASSSSSLPQQQLCSSWEQGRCLRGTQCKYLHLSAPSSAPSVSNNSNSLITSNTFPGFPTSSSSSSAAHHYSLPSFSPSPPASSSPQHPFSLSDLDDYQLDKSFRRPMAGLTNRMSNLNFYGTGPSASNGTQRKECWDWLAGRCQRGAMCKYMHAGMGAVGGSGGVAGSGSSVGGGGSGGMNDNVCHQWARAGQCQYGDVCKFAHISNYPLPPHGTQQRHTLPQQQTNDYTDDNNDYLNHQHTSSSSLLPTPTHNYPYLSTAPSAPPILFRDSRLGLDTEVCRFYAKHSRCKYSNACKFVHIHHGQGGVQVSGVTVTIAELQRLCALHGPGGFASMAGMSNGGGGVGGSMNGKVGVMGGGVVGGYDKKAVMALEKEVRELRELKELHDREQRSQQQQHQSPVERYHPLLPSNSFSSTFSSSSSSPVPQSSPAFSFASTATHLTSSNKSTPPLGGGLNGSFSPSLLHLNGSRQLTDNNKAVGSPLTAFSSSTASAFSSFQLASVESAMPPGVITTSSLFYSHSGPRNSLLSSSAAASAAELAAADADDDSQFITGSTAHALSGSGALLTSRSVGGRGGGGGVDELGGGSGVVCDHCGVNGSVWRDSYSNLCDECYTSLLR